MLSFVVGWNPVDSELKKGERIDVLFFVNDEAEEEEEEGEKDELVIVVVEDGGKKCWTSIVTLIFVAVAILVAFVDIVRVSLFNQ